MDVIKGLNLQNSGGIPKRKQTDNYTLSHPVPSRLGQGPILPYPPVPVIITGQGQAGWERERKDAYPVPSLSECRRIVTPSFLSFLH